MVENMPHYIYAFYGKYRLYEDDRQVENAGHRFHSGVRTINGVTRIATNVLELLDVSPFTRRDELVAKRKNSRYRKFGIVLVVNRLKIDSQSFTC